MNSHPILPVLAIAVAAPLLAEITVRPEIAAALVGAGMLSVLLFPTFAGVLLSRIAQSARQRTNLT
jgi:hypothetical protein